MDSSGQIPPFHPDSSHQPEGQKEEQSLPEARRYTPDSTTTPRQDLTPLLDYEVSSSESLLSGATPQLPDSCPEWFKVHEDLFQELVQFQQYFTDAKNQEAFLNGDGSAYNPLIIVRLRLETINTVDPLTDEQKLAIEEWQDTALKDCPISWRTLPLKLNHLNEDWKPSPQAARFIEYDEKNRLIQEEAGDFIPGWMNQEILGVPIHCITSQYWNLRNKHAQPGKSFLTMNQLKLKDPVLYNWLALFKDPRTLQEAGLTDRQLAVVDYRLSQADKEIAKHLKKKKCKTKSHHYTWKHIVAEPGLYEEVQQRLKTPKAPAPDEQHLKPAERRDIPERLKKKRTNRSPKISSETSSEKSVSPPTRKKKRLSQDSLVSRTSQQSKPDDISVGSSEFDNGPFLMVDKKKHPYSEEIKYAGKPDTHKRLKTFEKPHMYDFETASEDQIPKWSPSSPPSTATDRKPKLRVALNEIDIPPELFPLLGINSGSSSQRTSVEKVIKELESISYGLYHSHKLSKAEQLLKELNQLQGVLLDHFDNIYQQHSHDMYAMVHENYRQAMSHDKEPIEMELLLTEEQHDTLQKILTVMGELSERKFQARYYVDKFRQNPQDRSETWQGSESLKRPMTKTREFLSGKPIQTIDTSSRREPLIFVPAQCLSRLRYLEEISDPEQGPHTPAALCNIIIKNLKRLKRAYGNNMDVWDVNVARTECNHLLVVFDYFIEYLRARKTEDATAFNDHMAMDTLRTDLQNFKNALKKINHTEMGTVLSNHLRNTSSIIERLSSGE